jgi:hypothetical protein
MSVVVGFRPASCQEYGDDALYDFTHIVLVSCGRRTSPLDAACPDGMVPIGEKGLVFKKLSICERVDRGILPAFVRDGLIHRRNRIIRHHHRRLRFARESREAKSGRRDNNFFGIADNAYYHAASWSAGQGQKMAT